MGVSFDIKTSSKQLDEDCHKLVISLEIFPICQINILRYSTMNVWLNESIMNQFKFSYIVKFVVNVTCSVGLS